VKAELVIRDLAGRLLLRKQLNEKTGTVVTGNQLAGGMYFASVESNGLQSRCVSFVIAP
jgi:hypothetical protein